MSQIAYAEAAATATAANGGMGSTVLMIVLMIWQSPRQQKCEVRIALT